MTSSILRPSSATPEQGAFSFTRNKRPVVLISLPVCDHHLLCPRHYHSILIITTVQKLKLNSRVLPPLLRHGSSARSPPALQSKTFGYLHCGNCLYRPGQLRKLTRTLSCLKRTCVTGSAMFLTLVSDQLHRHLFTSTANTQVNLAMVYLPPRHCPARRHIHAFSIGLHLAC